MVRRRSLTISNPANTGKIKRNPKVRKDAAARNATVPARLNARCGSRKKYSAPKRRLAINASMLAR